MNCYLTCKLDEKKKNPNELFTAFYLSIYCRYLSITDILTLQI